MTLKKIDLATLQVFTRLTQYGLKQVSWEFSLTDLFYQDTLQLLIIKLARAIKRIRKALTLQLTPGEALCLFWTLEFWNEDMPDSYEYKILNPYFLTLTTS